MALGALSFILGVVTGVMILTAGWTDAQEAMMLVVAMAGVALTDLVLGFNQPSAKQPATLLDHPDGFEVSWGTQLPVAQAWMAFLGASFGVVVPSVALLTPIEAFGFSAFGAMALAFWGGLGWWFAHRDSQHSLRLVGHVLQLRTGRIHLDVNTRFTAGPGCVWVTTPAGTQCLGLPEDAVANVVERLERAPALQGDQQDVPDAIKTLQAQ